MKYNLDPSLKKSLFSRVKPPFNKLSFFFSRVLATIYPFPRKLKKILSYVKINVKEGESKYKVYIFHKLKKDISSLTQFFIFMEVVTNSNNFESKRIFYDTPT